MKNNLYAWFLWILLFLTFGNSYGQFIQHTWSLHVGKIMGNFHGKGLVEKDGFTFNSLYGNIENLDGTSYKATFNRKGHFSYVVCFDYIKGSNWNYTDPLINSYSQEYINSEVMVYSLTPALQIHNKYKNNGTLNRFSFQVELSPGIGYSHLKMEKSPFMIAENEELILPPNSTCDLFLGIKSSVGVEYILSRYFGLYCSYTFQHNWIKSGFYTDRRFAYTNFVLGVFVRLKKNKRFYL